MGSHPVSLTASLRRLLEQICPTDDELTAFCIDYFAEEVGRELSPAMSQPEKLNLLLTRLDAQSTAQD